MKSYYIRIETIAHVQPRPYADHEYIEELTFSQDDWHTDAAEARRPWYPPREFAIEIARVHCPWVDKDDPRYDWASRTFVAFERLEPSPRGNSALGPVSENHSDRWRIHVRSAYTD